MEAVSLKTLYHYPNHGRFIRHVMGDAAMYSTFKYAKIKLVAIYHDKYFDWVWEIEVTFSNIVSILSTGINYSRCSECNNYKIRGSLTPDLTKGFLQSDRSSNVDDKLKPVALSPLYSVTYAHRSSSLFKFTTAWELSNVTCIYPFW